MLWRIRNRKSVKGVGENCLWPKTLNQDAWVLDLLSRLMTWNKVLIYMSFPEEKVDRIFKSPMVGIGVWTRLLGALAMIVVTS